MQAKVLSKTNCAYCTKAKNLLQLHGININEVVIGVDISREDLLTQYPSFRTVPQVWIDDTLVGTYEDLQNWINERKQNGVQLSSGF